MFALSEWGSLRKATLGGRGLSGNHGMGYQCRGHYLNGPLLGDLCRSHHKGDSFRISVGRRLSL